MSRCCDRSHEGVTELDHVAAVEGDVLELNPGFCRQIRDCAGALDQGGQPRDMVGLYVRLEDGDDRCAERGR